VAGSRVGESVAEHFPGSLFVGTVRNHEQLHVHRLIVRAELRRQDAARRRLASGTADQPADGEGHRHGDREGRCRDEAAFAALAGTSPLPASSGRITRHRLNRGGDRALNRAIHTIALTRIRSCPRTRAYVERRNAEGKTPRQIRRCVKRYIARELYRALTQAMTTPNTSAAY